MGTGGQPRDTQLPAEAEEYLHHLSAVRRRSPLTIDAYRRDLRRYVAFLRSGAHRSRGPDHAPDDNGADGAGLDGAGPVDGGTHEGGRGVSVMEATPSDIEAFAAALRTDLAPSSVARTLVAVRNLHRWMATEGMRPDNPTAAMETPGLPAPLPKALTEAQVTAVLDAADAHRQRQLDDGIVDPFAYRDVAILETLYGTGARVSELCGLSMGDVDLDGRLVRLFGKRSRERIVPLGGAAARSIESWLDQGRPLLVPDRWRRRDDADAVFLGNKGSRLTRQGAWLVIQRWARAASLEAELSPHVLRHSCATHMLDRGADIRTVQEMLGHASLTTTQIYTRVATERLWQAYRDAHPRARAVKG